MPAAQELFVPRRLGPYVIGRKLGAGGMATVFAARQEGTHVKRLVALKVLSANISKDDEEHRSFMREALLATRLEHPNIVRTYDVGEVDGTLYLAMELVHGASLSACTKAAEGPSPIPVALKIVGDIARALHAAHELEDPEKGHLGVVHQDVSPQNILIGYDGAIKLVDFGVARFGTLEGSRTESLRGKPSYASPEQIAGKNIDRRTDVFALGVILWELLTGARLFKRETSAATYLAVLQDPIKDVRDVNPFIPDDLAAAVAKALERERDKRWPNTEQMRLAIEKARDKNNLGAMTPEELAAWVRSRVAPTINPAELEREIVKADPGAFTPSSARQSRPDFVPAELELPQSAPSNAVVPELDLPGTSQTRPARPKSDALADKATVRPPSSPDLGHGARPQSSPKVPQARPQSSPNLPQGARPQSAPNLPAAARTPSAPELPPPSSRRSPAAPPATPRQMPVASANDDDFDDMQIERDISGASVHANSYQMSAASRPRVPTASTGFELAAQPKGHERGRVRDDSALAAILPVVGAIAGFSLSTVALLATLRQPEGIAMKSVWPHAFDGTSAIESGAVAVTTLVLAVAAGFTGAKLRPRSWPLIASATGMLLMALAMVTVTLASGEEGTPPDGVRLLPFLVPIALIGIGLDLAMRSRLLFRSDSIGRKLVGVPVVLVGGLFGYLAYETSFLALH
ncbi:MAG TPA: protein kinase [Labilithrix sp.]